MPQIQLLDGNKIDFDKSITGFDLTKKISKSLEKIALIMEVDGDLKQMTKMLKELTLDSTKPTLAILGSREGGGKLMVATTENTIASERYNAVDILRGISSHISGGGGGRPTFAQGGGSNPDGLPDSLAAARELIGA